MSMRPALLLICAVLSALPVLAGWPARAATSGYYNADHATPALPSPKPVPATASGFSTVTTLSACLEKLPEAERDEIRMRYARPYQECLRRIALLDEAKEPAPGQAPPETPKGWTFMKVWTGDKPAPVKEKP